MNRKYSIDKWEFINGILTLCMDAQGGTFLKSLQCFLLVHCLRQVVAGLLMIYKTFVQLRLHCYALLAAKGGLCYKSKV